MVQSVKQQGKLNEVLIDGDVVRYIIKYPVDENEAMRLSDTGFKAFDSGAACRVIIDLQTSTEFSSAARRIWVQFLKHPKIKKTAIFGGNVFVRTLASFVIAAAGKKNIKFFSDEESAQKWLKS